MFSQFRESAKRRILHPAPSTGASLDTLLNQTSSRSDFAVFSAFSVVYLVWGSTYLGIRLMIEHLPPFLSAGVRFLLAGVLMLIYARWKRYRLPSTVSELRSIVIVSIAMLVGANGLVTWSEQWVESSQAALIVATSALWIAWLGTLGPQGQVVSAVTYGGLVIGVGGVALLVGEGLHLGNAPWFAYVGLLVSPFLWAWGSIVSKRRPIACAPFANAAVQTLVAGLILSTIGIAGGEGERWSWEPSSLGALLYLTVFGTCIAYGCFFWLVHQVTPAQLGTYAYVNPAVAVLLGGWLLEEKLSTLKIAGTFIILGSVLIVSWGSSRSNARAVPTR